jgi:hypothetical protein
MVTRPIWIRPLAIKRYTYTTFRLARISHKDRCERPESAGNVELQRQKARRHIEIFRGCFLGL